jgi:hypothetical protein
MGGTVSAIGACSLALDSHVPLPGPIVADFQNACRVATPIAILCPSLIVSARAVIRRRREGETHIRRAPDRAELLIEEFRVAIHAELVRSKHVVELVEREKLADDLRAERVASASVKLAPSVICLRCRGSREMLSPPWRDRKLFLVLIRVGPDKVRHWALMRNLAEPINDFDLVDTVYTRREA